MANLYMLLARTHVSVEPKQFDETISGKEEIDVCVIWLVQLLSKQHRLHMALPIL